MNIKQFNQGIEIITKVFGENVIKGPRLDRIQTMIYGRISGEGFIEICQFMCDSFRHPPLPVDFDKAVKDWRKNYYLEHGRHYAEEFRIKTEEEAPTCDYCNDLGIIRIQHHKPDDFDSLMRCHCKIGELNTTRMPQWDPSLANAYKKTKCPTEWFKPQVSRTNSDNDIYFKLTNVLGEWKKKNIKAEEYWLHLGFK